MLWRSWRSRSRRRIENLYTKTAYLVHYHFFQLFLHVFIQEKKTEEDYIFWGLIIKYYSLWDMVLDRSLIDLLLEIRFENLGENENIWIGNFFAKSCCHKWLMSFSCCSLKKHQNLVRITRALYWLQWFILSCLHPRNVPANYKLYFYINNTVKQTAQSCCHNGWTS